MVMACSVGWCTGGLSLGVMGIQVGAMSVCGAVVVIAGAMLGVAFCISGVLDARWLSTAIDRAGSAVCVVWLVLFEGVFFFGAVWA